MSDATPYTRPPDGEERAEEAEAGVAAESGPAATREALESDAPFRLSEEELNRREDRFTGPRKEQGPPLGSAENGDDTAAAAQIDEVDEVEETPPPELEV